VFAPRGGKLLIYHGWADQNVSPYNTVQYFRSVQEVLGSARTDKSIRLFMAPGMGHCGGGDGPNTFDKIGALDRWVEDGKPPRALLRRTARAARSTGHGPCAPIRRWRCTRVRAASTAPRISPANCRSPTNPRRKLPHPVGCLREFVSIPSKVLPLLWRASGFQFAGRWPLCLRPWQVPEDRGAEPHVWLADGHVVHFGLLLAGPAQDRTGRSGGTGGRIGRPVHIRGARLWSWPTPGRMIAWTNACTYVPVTGRADGAK
jgi:hypothetical protein